MAPNNKETSDVLGSVSQYKLHAAMMANEVRLPRLVEQSGRSPRCDTIFCDKAFCIAEQKFCAFRAYEAKAIISTKTEPRNGTLVSSLQKNLDAAVSAAAKKEAKKKEKEKKKDEKIAALEEGPNGYQELRKIRGK
ncbi:hypothetical protein FMEXI_2033 [Fusarium mexicanum]|uniref:Uncharacterized protein n=1 Tax=Fusarium mexicanum TaxID=751941 RepID=A0A8H5N5K0_9HYPO|nr:hypothetical protein FMEXI_2033 [Fusarium mexicanum]